MKFSSEKVFLSSDIFFQDKSNKVPLCKEHTIAIRNGYHCKAALVFVFILWSIHHSMFVDYEDLRNKYLVVFLLVSLTIFLVISLRGTVTKESLFFVVPLTLQMTTTYIFGNESTVSLPWQVLGDFMIMEVIMGQNIKYFLSIAIRREPGQEEFNHVILFRNSQPPFECLEMLYRDLQSILDKNR